MGIYLNEEYLNEHGGAHRRYGELEQKKANHYKNLTQKYIEDDDDRASEAMEQYQDHYINARTYGTPNEKSGRTKNYLQYYKGKDAFSKAMTDVHKNAAHIEKKDFQNSHQSQSKDAQSHRDHITKQNELKAKQNKLKKASIKEACEYILSVLDESEKKNESISIKGVPCSDDNGYTKELKKSINIINNNWRKILKRAADDMYEKYTVGLNDGETPRFKNSAALMKNLNLISWTFDAKPLSSGREVRTFCLTFDTDPVLDKFHVYTLYVTYFLDTKKISFDSVYDG